MRRVIVGKRKRKISDERNAELMEILESRRRAILEKIQGKIKKIREGEYAVIDSRDVTSDCKDDIELALIQIQTEELSKIVNALERLKEGAYGNCFECGEEISFKRLRALPFAVRCKYCQETLEYVVLNDKILARQRRRCTSCLFGMTI